MDSILRDRIRNIRESQNLKKWKIGAGLQNVSAKVGHQYHRIDTLNKIQDLVLFYKT